MAVPQTHFEVFDKLREFGRSLDKASNAIPKPTHDQTEETNRARACLQLRGILAEAKTFKGEVKECTTDTKNRLSFDQFLAVCERQVGKIREEIGNLEDYLAQYGYQKPTEKLPEIILQNSLEDTSDVLNSSGLCSSDGSPTSSTDKENQMPESEKTVNSLEKENDRKANESVCRTKPKEEDFLKTPELPQTVTKLIQPTDSQKEGAAASSPNFKEPLPPVTATPMIKSGKSNAEVKEFNTPDSSELPPQPSTRTPMIKANLFDASPTTETNANDSLIDDFPTPPVFATPGLQRYGSKQHGEVRLVDCNTIQTPPPPSFSSAINLLNPDDIGPPSRPSAPLLQSKPTPTVEKNIAALPDIKEEAFLQLPEYMQRQFSLEQVNYYIRRTSKFLCTKNGGDCGVVTEEEFMEALELGSLTRPFILVLIKLNYFTIIQHGLYKVIL